MIRSFLHGSLYSLTVTTENVCCLSVVTEMRLVLNLYLGIYLHSNVCQFRVSSLPRELSRCPAMDARSGSTIPDFRLHVTKRSEQL
jgi:hypothetical protein